MFKENKGHWRNTQSKDAHTTYARHTTPTSPERIKQHKNKPPPYIKFAYLNVNRSSTHTHSFLELHKHHDTVFTGEPFIFTIPTVACTNHPAFTCITPINANTKVVGYMNKKHARYKESSNRSGTTCTISLGISNVTGIYLPGTASIEDMEDAGNSHPDWIGSYHAILEGRITAQTPGCAPLAEWFVLGPYVVSLEESPSSSPSRPAKLYISFVGVK